MHVSVPSKAADVFSYGVVLLLAVVFFLSGIGKLLEPVGAVNALIMAFGVSPVLSKLSVFLLSNAEIVLALLLVTRRFRQAAMKAAAVVLAGFLVFLVYVKMNGIILDDCGCFGGLIRRTIPEAIVDEVILLLLTAGYFVMHRRAAEGKGEVVLEEG